MAAETTTRRSRRPRGAAEGGSSRRSRLDGDALLATLAEQVEQLIQENRQLKATLQLREHERATIATGRIVGSSFNSPRRFAILSTGSGDGVRIGMPVRNVTSVMLGTLSGIFDRFRLESG